MVPSHLQADQAQSRSRSPDLPPKRQAQGCLHSTEDRLVAITEAATARMLVPSTPCGVVHNSSERPTPASQCVLTAFSLPWLDELAACQRGGMLMNSPHERAAGPTSGATRRKRVVERQRECAEIHGGCQDQGPPRRAAVSDTSRVATRRRRSSKSICKRQEAGPGHNGPVRSGEGEVAAFVMADGRS